MPESTDASQIISYLTAQANAALSSALGTVPLQPFASGSLGNFPYNWQDVSNPQLFNQATYNWINASLKAGATPIQQDGVFTNAFINAIASISYSLSTSDQAALNAASANASQQQTAVLNTWLQCFSNKYPAEYYSSQGTDTPMQPIDAVCDTICMTWANPTTTLQAIQNSLNLNALLNKTPASGQPVLPVLVDYLNALSSSLSLQNAVSLNTGYLNRAKGAAQTATTGNGGMVIDDNTPGSIVPAYNVSPVTGTIQNALKNTKSPVTMSMTVSRTTSNTYTVHVAGGTGFGIPIFDFLTVSVGGSADYFSSSIATTSNTITVNMSYPGVNLVQFGPDPFQESFNGGQSKYWYYMDPIRQAIRNGTKDVSGYKFSPVPSTDFSASGPFAFLQGAAISAYPTITIVCQSSDYQSIATTFTQTTSSTVRFLGIPIGSASETTCSNSVKTDASSSTVTITISPPASVVSINQNNALAWILGVQPCYPAA